jgi:hypothetical protein
MNAIANIDLSHHVVGECHVGPKKTLLLKNTLFRLVSSSNMGFRRKIMKTLNVWTK